MAQEVVSVLIADDHPAVREGLSALINRRSDIHVVAQASNGREAVEQFMHVRPDVALVDLHMPVMDGIKTLTTILDEEPSARVVIISTYQGEEDIYRALHAGAKGYILKDSSIEQLLECIRVVANGKTWIPPQIGAKLAKRVSARELTQREREVLRTMALGKSNKEIGVALGIAESTVKVHVTHILEKLAVTGRGEAINAALEKGLIHPDWTSAA